MNTVLLTCQFWFVHHFRKHITFWLRWKLKTNITFQGYTLHPNCKYHSCSQTKTHNTSLQSTWTIECQLPSRSLHKRTVTLFVHHWKKHRFERKIEQKKATDKRFFFLLLSRKDSSFTRNEQCGKWCKKEFPVPWFLRPRLELHLASSANFSSHNANKP